MPRQSNKNLTKEEAKAIANAKRRAQYALLSPEKKEEKQVQRRARRAAMTEEEKEKEREAVRVRLTQKKLNMTKEEKEGHKAKRTIEQAKYRAKKRAAITQEKEGLAIDALNILFQSRTVDTLTPTSNTKPLDLTTTTKVFQALGHGGAEAMTTELNPGKQELSTNGSPSPLFKPTSTPEANDQEKSKTSLSYILN